MATTDKYDRQLRLWGANGQRRLMESNILLIRADSVGTETLKNLVLPGVGSFTILDDFAVDQQDATCNFFVTIDSIGRPRAEVVASLLCEMNDDVKGAARVANFQNVFQTEPTYFKSFSLIIAANLPESQLAALSRYCWSEGIALMAVRSYGLLGAVRVQLKDHSIIESKQEHEQSDLRIANPFPALTAFCEQQSYVQLLGGCGTPDADGEAVDSMQHAHVPYIVILYHAIKRWKLEHGGREPGTFAEKEAFKASIKSMAKDYSNEVNFQEAVRESYRAYTRKSLSSELQALLVSCSLDSLSVHSSNFEFMATALARFVADTEASELPAAGGIPDMTATTEEFVRLQQVYQQKAEQDVLCFQNILAAVMQGVGAAKERISDISADEVQTFCKNASTIMNITTSTISDELASACCNAAAANAANVGTTRNAHSNPAIDDTTAMDISNSNSNSGPSSSTAMSIVEALEDDLYADPQQTPLIWYLVLRAAEAFFSQHGRWPGAQAPDASLERDQSEVFYKLSELCSQLGIHSNKVETLENNSGSSENTNGADRLLADESQSGPLVRKAHADEVSRYGGGELHSTSALIGGVAAQEAVKIITHQYIPLNNTYIFNGIAACAATYQL